MMSPKVKEMIEGGLTYMVREKGFTLEEAIEALRHQPFDLVGNPLDAEEQALISAIMSKMRTT